MVDIVMAVYNGEKYLSEQIESILAQSYKNWRLYICDDNSSDKSYEIAKSYCEKYSDKIFLKRNSVNSGSAGMNFLNMIREATGDIIMTCDQDDIWLEDKLELQVKLFEKVDYPLLVHSDLKLIDENKRVISQSMIKSQKIDVTRSSVNKMLVQNNITGCTMAINRELANLIKVPSFVEVHDWYIGLLASIFGKIVFMDRATVLYRQHSNNVCGAVNMESVEYISQRFKDKNRGRYMLELGYNMAEEIARLYKLEIPALLEYGKMKSYSKIKKLYTVIKYGIWKNGFVRKLGQIYFM